MTPSARYQQAVDDGTIESDPAQRRALEHIDALQLELLKPASKSWLKWFSKHESIQGLYLWGGVGTGKTLLMDNFYHSLPEGMARRVHFHRFMQSVHERRSSMGDQQNPLALIGAELSAKFRVLCLDEFAVTDITDAMILYGLLDALFDRGVTLFTTSNIPRADLYKNGLQRDRFKPAISLLQTHTRELEVDSGNDYRTAFLRQDSIYHTPLDDNAATAIAATFSHLAGAWEDSKSSIDINGRDVPVVATGSGVVWFEFNVLCEGNRSKVDYIDVARRFHTVILANVPVLDDLGNDATRRLIELVDELYDRGVNLVVSAATQPEGLYTGKRLADPFRRTISRLGEMSSLDYLGRPHMA